MTERDFIELRKTRELFLTALEPKDGTTIETDLRCFVLFLDSMLLLSGTRSEALERSAHSAIAELLRVVGDQARALGTYESVLAALDVGAIDSERAQLKPEMQG